MADISEWFKGITLFIFLTIMYYFLWTNIFSGVISFLGSDIYGLGSSATTSISILSTMGWVSFIFLWLATVPIFLIYSIFVGSRGEIKTQPLMIIKAVGSWVILMPLLSLFYGLVYFLTTALNDTNIIDTGMQTTASGFSWILGIIVLGALIFVPFYFILQGYGKINEGNKVGDNE